MTTDSPVGPTACKGNVGKPVPLHCPGCADAAALRKQLAEALAEVERLKGLLPAGTVEEFAKRVGAIHAAREKLAAAAIPEGTPGGTTP